MKSDETGGSFRPFWFVRVLWLLVLLGVGWWAGGEMPRVLLAGIGAAFALQLLLLLLHRFKRLPPWHDLLSTLAAAAVGSLAFWLFPERVVVWLLLGTVPLLEAARWRGGSAFLFVFLFPLPILAFLYVQKVIGVAELPWLAAWGVATLMGMALATFPPVPHGRSAPVENEVLAGRSVLAKVAQLLARETRYDRILEVLVRDGCALLDEGNRTHRSKALALTLKPGIRDVLVVATHHNMDASYTDQSYELEGVLAILMQEGEPLETTGDQPPFDKLRALQGHQLLLFPLRTGLDLYGAVLFATRHTERAKQEDLQRTLIALADQASLALHNSVLQRQLVEDRSERLGGEGDARHQLARDLHDGPVQRVAAISMQLEFLKALMKRQPERALAELEQLQEVAKLASQEMRTMLFSLRPVVLESEGLAAALETFVQRLREQDKLEIRFESESLPRLDDKVEEVAFAILQEAINNAKKYASNAPIVVRLVRGQEMVIGQVRDHGPGFDLKAITSSYGTRASLGLLNMKERAEMVGGVLKIDTAPGKGTTISVAVPFRME